MKKVIVGVGISLFLAGWVLWGVEWSLMWACAGKIRWWYIIPYFVLLLIIQTLRSLRWEILLQPLIRVGQSALFPINAVGLFAVMFFPVRSGELVRPYLLSQRNPISMSTALATIVVERVLDIVSILIFIVAVSLSFDLPKWVSAAAAIAGGLIAAIIVFLFLMIRKRPVLMRLSEKVLRPFPSRVLQFFQNFIVSFSEGARILAHWKTMLYGLAFSLLMWALVGFLNYIMFFAFSFPLSLSAAFIVLIIVDLGLMIPAAPGYVGSFQFLYVVSLALFGIGREEALSFSILSHVVQILFVLVLGLIFLPMIKISGFSLRGKMPTSVEGV